MTTRARVRAATVVAVLAATVAAWHAAPVATTAALAVVTVAAMLAARHRLRCRQLRRRHVAPMVAALSTAVGASEVKVETNRHFRVLVPRPVRELSPAEQSARRWYGRRVEPVLHAGPNLLRRAGSALARPTVPLVDQLRRPSSGTARMVVTITAAYLTEQQRRFVTAIVAAKMAVPGLTERWDLVGDKVRVTYTVRTRPPRRVGADTLATLLPTLDGDTFLVGMGAGNRPVTVNLRDDSPHIAVSAGSGAGKSALACALAVQVLARGGQVVVCDRKGSHKWAVGLERVDYCTRPAQMHEALLRIAALADRRNAEALHQPDGWDPGPRVLVVLEELNATIGQLRDHWQATRGRGEAKSSPAVRAIADLLHMGRAAKVNVVGIAQMLTARAIGGPEARENFAVRCLARYTANAWKMLVPEVPMPAATRTLGRWQVVAGGQATETQVVHLSAAEARRIAGVPTSPQRDVPPVTRDVPGDKPASGDKLTIAEAIEQGVIPWSREAVKKRMQRSQQRPDPVAHHGQTAVYRRVDLVAWVASETASTR